MQVAYLGRKTAKWGSETGKGRWAMKCVFIKQITSVGNGA